MSTRQLEDVLKEVRRIQIVARRQVNDLLAGEYLSVFKGRGMEFDAVREYVPGDEIRSIDWNVTARTGTPFVKTFCEERKFQPLSFRVPSPLVGEGWVGGVGSGAVDANYRGAG